MSGCRRRLECSGASLQEPEPAPLHCLLPVPLKVGVLPRAVCPTPPPCSGKWICTNKCMCLTVQVRRDLKLLHGVNLAEVINAYLCAPSHCLLQAGQHNPCSKQVCLDLHPLPCCTLLEIMFVTYFVCVCVICSDDNDILKQPFMLGTCGLAMIIFWSFY